MFNIKKGILKCILYMVLILLGIYAAIVVDPIAYILVAVFAIALCFVSIEVISTIIVASEPMRIVISKNKVVLFFSRRYEVLRYLSIHVISEITQTERNIINGSINKYFQTIKMSGAKVERIELDQTVIDIVVSILKNKISYAEKYDEGNYSKQVFKAKNIN